MIIYNFLSKTATKSRNKIIILQFLFVSCYSFTGGSVPSHLKTMQIISVVDNSNFGDPECKVELETELFNKFQTDGSFEIMDETADAKISVVITSIQESTQTVSPGELESERRLTISVAAEYYDNVNNKQIWKKNFSSYSLFDVNNAFAARKEAIAAVIPQIAEDVMLAVVSGW